jgi:type III secretion protein J
MGDTALIPSPRAEQLRMLAGTAGEIEHSLLEVDGVKSARVHLAVAATEPLADPTVLPPATASVLLRHRAERAPISIPEVKRLVAGAVSGLTEDRVSVVLKPVAAVDRAALPFTRVGPLLVSKASAVPLRWALSATLLTNIALTCVLLWLWGRHRRLGSQQLPNEPN